jgi:hypothetical protein
MALILPRTFLPVRRPYKNQAIKAHPIASSSNPTIR